MVLQSTYTWVEAWSSWSLVNLLTGSYHAKLDAARRHLTRPNLLTPREVLELAQNAVQSHFEGRQY